MVSLNSTLNFVIPPVLVFQQELYYKVERLLTGLTAQQKGTTARWYSNKTLLSEYLNAMCDTLKRTIEENKFDKLFIPKKDLMAISLRGIKQVN